MSFPIRPSHLSLTPQLTSSDPTGKYRSVRLAFSSELELEAFLFSDDRWRKADLELPFPIEGRFKERLNALSPRSQESTLLEIFNHVIRRYPEGGGRVILTQKMLGGGASSSKGSSKQPNNASSSSSITEMVNDDRDAQNPLTNQANRVSSPPVFDIGAQSFRINFQGRQQQAESVRVPSSVAAISANNTKELAHQIKNRALGSQDFILHERLALDILNIFGRMEVKIPHLGEVLELAYANNLSISRELIRLLIREIESGVLLDIEMLEALRISLEMSLIEVLDGDNLIRLLRVIIEKIESMHQQSTLAPKIFQALNTLSGILEAMGDANVIQIDRVNLQESLYETLSRIEKSEDLFVKSAAAYAKQALVRIPNNELKLSAFIRRSGAVIQGVVGLAQAVLDKSPTALIGVYTNFKEAAHSLEGEAPWADDLRMIKLLIGRDLFDQFELFTQKLSVDNPYLVAGVVAIMDRVVENHPLRECRLRALTILVEIYRNNKLWGPHQLIKNATLGIIVKFAEDPQISLRSMAFEYLSAFEASGAKIIRFPKTAPRPHTTELFTTANRTLFVSLPQKLDHLRKLILENLEIENNLSTYIPVFASRNRYDAKDKTHDLNSVIETFLAGDDQILLLLGDSGAGKSTYLHFLERMLWRYWSPGKPIPLYINLATLRNPFHEAIEESLKAKGFKESDLEELKAKYTFLFLFDCYDELKDRQNLYSHNRVDEWVAKMVISCRSQHLLGEQSSYQHYFLPTHNNNVSLDEVTISPFNSEQIEDYIRKFINRRNAEGKQGHYQTAEEYRKDIEAIPALGELITTPFFLNIVVQVLPSIVRKYKAKIGNNQPNLLSVEIYDAFREYWFNTEARRLISSGAWNELTDPKRAISDFAGALASKMIQNGVSAIHYEPKVVRQSLSLMDDPSSIWEPFFATDARTTALRSAMRLCLVGQDTYAFPHKSLYEYLYARAIAPAEQLKNDQAHLDIEEKTEVKSQGPSNSDQSMRKPSSIAISSNYEIKEREEKKFPEQSVRIPFGQEIRSGPITYTELNAHHLKEEPEVVRLIAELVKKDPKLIDYLFDIIYRSNGNSNGAIAAANAATILNVAGVNFSLRKLIGVNIQGADLSGAICSFTNFAGANLDDVRFDDAFLDNAVMTDCEMDRVEFGQKPFIQLGGPLDFIDFSSDGQFVIYKKKSDYITQFAQVENGQPGYFFLKDISRNSAVNHVYNASQAAFRFDSKEIVYTYSDEYSLIHVNKLFKTADSDKDHNNNIYPLMTHYPHTITALATLYRDPPVLGFDDGTIIQLVKNYTQIASAKLEKLGAHRGKVTVIRTSPDGKWIASGSEDKIVQLLDLDTRNTLRLEGHTAAITSVDISPDGNFIISGSVDKTVRLWAFKTSEEKFCFKGHREAVTSVHFSSDGIRAVSGSEDKTVRVVNCLTGKEEHCFHGHKEAVIGLAFTSNGIVSASKDGVLRKWNLGGLETLQLKRNKLIREIRGIENAHDPLLELFGRNNPHLAYWNSNGAENLKKLHETKTHHATFHDIALSNDGQLILVIDPRDSNTIILKNATNGRTAEQFRGHSSPVTMFRLSNDSERVLSGSSDNTIRLWNRRTEKELACVKISNFIPSSATFSSDSKWILVGGKTGDKSSSLLLEMRSEGSSLKRHTLEVDSCVYCSAFSPDNQNVLIGSSTDITEWHCTNGERGLSLSGHSKIVTGVAYSSDGSLIISCSLDRTIRLWDAKTGQQIQCFPQSASPISLKLLSDGQHLLITNNLPAVQLWKLKKDINDYKLVLVWSTATVLSTNNLALFGVKKLSPANKDLILQHGQAENVVNGEAKENVEEKVKEKTEQLSKEKATRAAKEKTDREGRQKICNPISSCLSSSLKCVVSVICLPCTCLRCCGSYLYENSDWTRREANALCDQGHE